MLWIKINVPKHPPIHGSYMSHFKLNIFFHKWKMSQISVGVNVPTFKVHLAILHALRSTARIFYLKYQLYIRLYKLFSLNICASLPNKKNLASDFTYPISVTPSFVFFTFGFWDLDAISVSGSSLFFTTLLC